MAQVALKKNISKLADAAGFPLIGAAQATIANAVVAHSITDTATELDAANETELEGFYDALGVKINAVLDALAAHGLIKV